MKKFWKAVLIIAAFFVLGFTLLMMLPDDEDGDYGTTDIEDALRDSGMSGGASVNAGKNESQTGSFGSQSAASGAQDLAGGAQGSQAQQTSSAQHSYQNLLGTNGTETSGTGEGIFSGSMVRSKKARTADAQTVTVLCYVNGSNLETEDQEATGDILEMIAAPYSSKVNILIQTMGTKKWAPTLGISSKKTQRFLVKENSLELVDDSLGQLDCTRSSTLADFIRWGAQNYPADRYILLFWNHGGGPVYGFGYDEFQNEDDAMSVDEIQLALANGGVYFDFIGMDCCIMSCMEICCACYDHCDYMILSEDFESGLGWSYKGWMTALAQQPSIDTEALAKIAIDDMIRANETETYGDDSILALIDESVMKVVYKAWTDFAYANEATLLDTNYSRHLTRKDSDRAHPALLSKEDYSLADYYITDIMAAAQNIDSQESKALESAVSNAIAYCKTTAGDAYLTGLSVTLPYGDPEFYGSLKTIFGNCGFDSEYIEWLGKFTSVSNGHSSYYDYGDWDDLWSGSGWTDYLDSYDWSDWDYWDDDSYWSDDDSCGWSEWDFLDFWTDDWWNYDSYDYYNDGYYCDDWRQDEHFEDWYYSDDPWGYWYDEDYSGYGYGDSYYEDYYGGTYYGGYDYYDDYGYGYGSYDDYYYDRDNEYHYYYGGPGNGYDDYSPDDYYDYSFDDWSWLDWLLDF